jgi:hypothetical protein
MFTTKSERTTIFENLNTNEKIGPGLYIDPDKDAISNVKLTHR